jgi:NADPH:quinone reductase-like Zn-dependent oxidoreductase
VLVWGVGGGVASAALVLARAAGARVIAASSHAHKLTKARSHGAEAVIDSGKEEVAQRVRELTDGAGVHVVVEHVGAATWPVSLEVVRRGGRVVTCGASTGGKVPAGLHRIFWKQIAVLGSTMGTDSEFRSLLALLAAGKLRPVIDSVFGLEDAARAHERLEASEQFGKVLLRIDA